MSVRKARIAHERTTLALRMSTPALDWPALTVRAFRGFEELPVSFWRVRAGGWPGFASRSEPGYA
jgi:hypothetical protein